MIQNLIKMIQNLSQMILIVSKVNQTFLTTIETKCSKIIPKATYKAYVRNYETVYNMRL